MKHVTHGQVFTFAQAVEVTGKSRSTLHRKRDMLRQAGAHQDAAGVWRIPVSALVACGLLDTPETPRKGSGDTRLVLPDETPLSGEVEQLRRALMEAERRADVAEARAAERDRLIEAQSRTIALLEARDRVPPDGASQQPASTPPNVQAEMEPQREEPPTALRAVRRWWRGAGKGA